MFRRSFLVFGHPFLTEIGWEGQVDMGGEKIIFSRAVVEFLKIKKAGTPRTYQDYAYRCGIIQKIARLAKISKKPLDGITVIDLSRAIVFLDQPELYPKLGPTTKNKIIACLRTLFLAYIQMGRISNNPVALLPKRRATPSQARPFTADELNALLNVKPDTPAQYRDRAMIYTLADAGLRANELLNLKITDWKDQTLFIAKGKGGKPRQVSIGNVTRQALEEYILHYRVPGSEYLFVTLKGKSLNIHSLNKRIQAHQRKAGIGHASPHRFRATFATNFAKVSNGNLVQLQALLGHATMEMSRKYVQLAAADEAQLTNTRESQVDRFLQPRVEPEKPVVPEQESLLAQIDLLNLKIQKMTLEVSILKQEYSYQLR
jgi:integrase